MYGKKIFSFGETLSHQLAGFRSVGLAFTIFSLTNIVIFLLISLHSPLLDWLSHSPDRPWGILTSAFVHADLSHLVNNLRGFIFAGAFFVIVNMINPVKTRRRSSRIFLWLIFLSGFTANTIEFLGWKMSGVSNVRSWGASGVVYAAIGALLAFALCNFPAHLRNFFGTYRKSRKIRRKPTRRFDWGFAKGAVNLLSMTLPLALLVMLFSDPGGFLSASPETDVLAHGLGFSMGFLVSMALFYIHVTKEGVKFGK